MTTDDRDYRGMATRQAADISGPPRVVAPATMGQSARRLLDTQRAFDSVAADYDGPTGNNTLIQWMRLRLWRAVLATVPRGGRLLDLGCGTGLDAAYFASEG